MSKTILIKKQKNFICSIKSNFKDICFSVLILFIILVILSNPSIFSVSTISGLKLFFYNVLPGLFPFMFLTKLLTEIGLILKISNKLNKFSNQLFGTSGLGFYVFIMSILSGYPIGAKIIGDFYAKGLITKNEAKRLSIFCTTSGPIFIIGAVGTGMLKNLKLGIIIYISHVFSSLLLGVISNIFNKSKDKQIQNTVKPTIEKPKNIFSKCINETVSSIMIIAAYITIFYLISELFIQLNIFKFLIALISPLFKSTKITSTEISGILFGILEVTRGCKQLSICPTNFSICAITGIISFSGISILMQEMEFLKNTQTKMHNLIFYKFVHCVLSVFVCQLLLIIF